MLYTNKRNKELNSYTEIYLYDILLCINIIYYLEVLLYSTSGYTVLANIDKVASAHRTHVCRFFPRYLCAYEGDDFGAWWDAIHPKQTVAYRYDATMVVDDSVH